MSTKSLVLERRKESKGRVEAGPEEGATRICPSTPARDRFASRLWPLKNQDPRSQHSKNTPHTSAHPLPQQTEGLITVYTVTGRGYWLNRYITKQVSSWAALISPDTSHLPIPQFIPHKFHWYRWPEKRKALLQGLLLALRQQMAWPPYLPPGEPPGELLKLNSRLMSDQIKRLNQENLC